jgi:hypothetical protein
MNALPFTSIPWARVLLIPRADLQSHTSPEYPISVGFLGKNSDRNYKPAGNKINPALLTPVPGSWHSQGLRRTSTWASP